MTNKLEELISEGKRFGASFEKALSSVLVAAAVYAIPIRMPLYVVAQPDSYTAQMSYATMNNDYVHIPSWIKVHRASMNEFGPYLFGLARIGTGDVYVRSDLEGKEFSEVLQHEVFHQLYPSAAEHEIRALTRARFGSDAAIHQRIGLGF